MFERLGIRTINQLRQWPIDTLKSRFSSQGEFSGNWPMGPDPVAPERETKSVASFSMTYETEYEGTEDQPNQCVFLRVKVEPFSRPFADPQVCRSPYGSSNSFPPLPFSAFVIRPSFVISLPFAFWHFSTLTRRKKQLKMVPPNLA